MTTANPSRKASVKGSPTPSPSPSPYTLLHAPHSSLRRVETFHPSSLSEERVNDEWMKKAMTLDPGLAARLLAGIRTHTAQRTGCPEWDTPGIAKALIATEGPPGAVLAAAALAAEDATLRAPSAAAFRTHWPVQASAPPKVSHDIPCPEHTGQTMPCPTCRESVRPPKPEELAAARDAARSAREAAVAQAESLRSQP